MFSAFRTPNETEQSQVVHSDNGAARSCTVSVPIALKSCLFISRQVRSEKELLFSLSRAVRAHMMLSQIDDSLVQVMPSLKYSSHSTGGLHHQAIVHVRSRVMDRQSIVKYLLRGYVPQPWPPSQRFQLPRDLPTPQRALKQPSALRCTLKRRQWTDQFLSSSSRCSPWCRSLAP